MTALEILNKAKENHYALGSFNACNIETVKAVLESAKKLQAPVLIEASPGEANYLGKKALATLIRIYKNEYNVPIILNLDHAQTVEDCMEAVDAGFDYVHFDGSKLPLEENIQKAKKVVEYAHKNGVLVEGEMDHIEGSSADHTQESTKEFLEKSQFTNPNSAKRFVVETGVDTFASFIGNLHGLYAEKKHLQLEILKTITELLPNTFLSLHGGSGIENSEVQKAIQMGIVKVNVNSELRIAFKETLQNTLNESKEVAIYKLTPPAIESMKKIIEEKIQLFGSQGKIA